MENLEAQVLDVSKVKIIPSDTEIPVYNNSILTERALCTEFPENKEILHRLEAIFNPLNVTECSDDLFNGEYETITDIKKLKKVLSELLIRFDTSPKNYTKKDYLYLMGVIYKTLLYLYELDSETSEDILELNNRLSQEILDRIQAVTDEATIRFQNDQLLQQLLNNEISKISGLIYNEESARVFADTQLDNKISQETHDRELEVTRLEELISSEESARQTADQNLQNTKQDNLIAGDNISITNNVISAVDTIYDDTQIRSDIADLQASKQDNLTAGNNISITNNVISAVDTIYDDTEIKSDISNLEQNKQDNLIAGSNILISGNTISATDTIYDDTEVRGLINDVDQKVDNLDDFTCGTIVPTTTNFVEGTEYTVHEALQRTANLFEGYQGEINDINELIPNQTTPQNQLADKAFVNSTVATNAANFRGNWNNYTSVPTNINDYPEDYSGNKTPTNNDYLVVLDGTDYGATYTGMWRFIYIGDWSTSGKIGWQPLYRVGSAFTQAQQDAIDSRITSTKVGTYDGYATTINALLTDKLDKVYTADKVYGTNNQGSQIAYTAGDGISFTNGLIVNTRTTVAWGNITGTLSNQTDLNTVLTSKEDKSNKVTSISNSSTDIQYPSAKCVYDEFTTTVISETAQSVSDVTVYTNSYIPVIDKTSDSSNSFTIAPNKMYMFGTRTSLSISLNNGESGIVNEYMFLFTSGSTATTLNVPNTVVWLKDPDIQTGKKYAVSIENNLGIIGEWSNE